MRNFKLCIILIVLILTLGTSLEVIAQRATDFITYTQRSSRGFTGNQITMLNRMISNPLYKAHYYVSLQDLHSITEANGKVTINLPKTSSKFLDPTSNDIDGDGVMNLGDIDAYDPCNPTTNNANCVLLIPTEQVLYTFDPVKIEAVSETEYTYHGEWNPCDEENNGYITIIARDGNLYGQININETVYEIHDLGGRKNILVEWDNSQMPVNDCSTSAINSIDDRPDENLGESRSGGCNVRVLVLFTDAAALVRDPVAAANLFMTQTNQIVSNSKAMTSFTLVGVQNLAGFVETGGAGGFEATLPAFSALPLTTTLRNAAFADQVVLLADINDPDVFGIAFTPLGPNFGFSVVEIDGAGGRFTFSHELAHNFSCFHDNATGVNARGKQFNNGCLGLGHRSRTVLARAGANDSRIMHYSNPDVKFKCRSTGNSDRNNAGQISTASCTVAGYRADPPPPFNITVTGPETGIPGQTYNYCVAIDQCPNVLSIAWSFSYDGFHYTPVNSGNTACITLTMPLHGSIYVRVRVICQGGGDLTEFWETYNENEDPKFKGCGWGEESAKSTNNQLMNDFTFAPNPTNGELNIEFDVFQKSKIRFAIYDKVGVERKLLVDKDYEEGSYKLNFNIADFINSNYFIQKSENGNVVTKQIIKL